MKIAVVDDEAPSRRRLGRLLGEIASEYQIFFAANGMEALQLVEKERLAVMLLDVRMPVMDGMETALHLSKFENPPAIIFTTAYDNYALQAFEANALDYLLKPIKKERLAEALRKTKPLMRWNAENLGNVTRRHIAISSRDEVKLIPLDKIYYIKADQKYLTVFWSEGEDLVEESLKDLEQEFNDFFLRIHRNTLVVRGRIAGMKIVEGQPYLVLSTTEDLLPISRRQLSEVKSELRKIGKR